MPQLKHACFLDASILSSSFRKLAFMTYGTRLAYALEREEKSRADLADALDVSVQAIGQVITGGRSGSQTFTAANHMKAARFLKVSPDWLATGDGDMRPSNVWPFERLQPDHVRLLSAKDRRTVENLALSLLQEEATQDVSDVSDSNVSASPRKSEEITWTLPSDIKPGRSSGKRDSDAAPPASRRRGGSL